jgi:predicted TIM-barrel fold metal-dependent hydrolase
MYQRYLETEFRHRAPSYVRENKTGANTWMVGDKAYPPKFPSKRSKRRYAGVNAKKAQSPEHMEAAARGFDAVATLRGMDVEGVDLAMLYRSGGGMLAVAVDEFEPDYAFALARAYNNWLADFRSEDPQRLKGVAMVPLHDIEMAIEETRRAVHELGLVGITLHPEKVRDRLLYDPEVEPLWAEVERLDISVGIHGTSTGLSKEDFTLKYFDHPAGGTLTHALSFQVQILTAMGGIIFSGLLERHPNLRIAFLEANCSWLPWWLYRMDDQWEKYGPSEEGDILTMQPSAYFRRNCFVSVDPDEHLAWQVVEEVGNDNLVFSTDFPHADSAFPNATNEFLGLDKLSDETKRKVLWDNCARYYNLKA